MSNVITQKCFWGCCQVCYQSAQGPVQLQQYYDPFSWFERPFQARRFNTTMVKVFGCPDDTRNYLSEAASPFSHLQGNMVLGDAVWFETSPGKTNVTSKWTNRRSKRKSLSKNGKLNNRVRFDTRDVCKGQRGGVTGQVFVSFPCNSVVQAPELEEETEKR